MCGRYGIFPGLGDGVATEKVRPDLRGLEQLRLPGLEAPRYNVAPTQEVTVFQRGADGRPEPVKSQWGWGPQINARAETVTEWRPFPEDRVVVPASAWYEWVGSKRSRQPWLIYPEAGGMLAFAGLRRQDRHVIMTTASAPDGLVATLHHRTPVMLSPEEVTEWLDPGTPRTRLLELLRPREPVRLSAHPVSPEVGNVRFEGPACVAPIAVQPTLW